MKLLDPDSPEGPESHNTDVVINEQSPRFRAKFDFVYISATSMLTLTVYEKAGVWDSVMKLGKKVRVLGFCSPFGALLVTAEAFANTELYPPFCCTTDQYP